MKIWDTGILGPFIWVSFLVMSLEFNLRSFSAI